MDTPGLKIENNVLDLVAIPEGGAADWFGVNRGRERMSEICIWSEGKIMNRPNYPECG